MIDQGGSEDVRIGHERHQIRSKRGIAVLVSRYMPLENNAARTWVVLDLAARACSFSRWPAQRCTRALRAPTQSAKCPYFGVYNTVGELAELAHQLILGRSKLAVGAMPMASKSCNVQRLRSGIKAGATAHGSVRTDDQVVRVQGTPRLSRRGWCKE